MKIEKCPEDLSQRSPDIRYICRERREVGQLEERELERLVERYGAGLFRYAYTILCSYQDAEDVVQDVFIAAYRAWEQFDGGDVSAWLYKMTYNRCVDYVRRRKSFSLYELREDEQAVTQEFDSGYSPDIIRGLEKLKDVDRAILLGRITGEMSYEDMARRLNMSQQNVRKRYERARKKLMGYLKDREGRGRDDI